MKNFLYYTDALFYITFYYYTLHLCHSLSPPIPSQNVQKGKKSFPFLFFLKWWIELIFILFPSRLSSFLLFSPVIPLNTLIFSLITFSTIQKGHIRVYIVFKLIRLLSPKNKTLPFLWQDEMVHISISAS